MAGMAVLVLLAILLAATACTPPPKTANAAPAPVHDGRRAPITILGKASWYGKFHHGRRTASGEIFDMRALTAAHRTLPLGTHVRVTNLSNGRWVNVRVNDRGPAIRSRILDVSHGVAVKLDAVAAGVFPVELVVLDGRPERAPIPPTSGAPRRSRGAPLSRSSLH